MPKLEFKMVGDYHVITSPDVPGLYVADLDRAKAEGMVADSIEALRRMADRRDNIEDLRQPLDRVA